MFDITKDVEGGIILEAKTNGIGLELFPLLKTAEIKTTDYLIKEAFANQEDRLFPMDTEANVAASALYMSVQANEVPDLYKEACNEALEEFGINYRIPMQELEKTASIEDQIGERYVLTERKKLPVLDADMLKKSASVFFESLDKLTQKEVLSGSQELAKFAEEYGFEQVDVHEKLPMYTLSSPSNLSKVASAVMNRKADLIAEGEEGTDYDGILQKLAEKRLENNGDISYDDKFNLEILADVVSLDKIAGLSSVYSPIEDVYNFVVKSEPLEKVASQSEIEFNKTKTLIKDDLVKMAGEDVASLVCDGNKFSYDKFTEVRDTLHEETIAAILGE